MTTEGRVPRAKEVRVNDLALERIDNKTDVAGYVRGLEKDNSARDSQSTHSQYRDSVSRAYDDKELLLISNRRKLLAQRDWLALRPTKPLRLDTRAPADGERVGRRRKIKRSSGVKRAEHHEHPSHRSGGRISPFLMSGALPEHQVEPIKIRVGTSAFESRWSHSRQSRRSNASDATGAIQRSPSLSHLSEESMLLGADGDTFDAEQVQVPIPGGLNQSYELAEQSLVVGPGSQTVVLDREESTAAASHWNVFHREPSQLQPGFPNDDALSRSLQEALENLAEFPTAQSARAFGHAQDSPPGCQVVAGTESPGQGASPRTAELEWKRLFGIPTKTESLISKISNGAVVSSSQHLTASEPTPSPDRLDLQAYSTAKNVIKPMIDGADARKLHPLQLCHSQNHISLNMTWHSFVKQGDAMPVQKEDHHNDDGEALWRDFIIGSQDGHSEDDIHLAWQRSRNRKQHDSEAHEFLQLSGLGTSDQATQGDTKAPSASASSAEWDTNDCNVTILRRDDGSHSAQKPYSKKARAANIHAAATPRAIQRHHKRKR